MEEKRNEIIEMVDAMQADTLWIVWRVIWNLTH